MSNDEKHSSNSASGYTQCDENRANQYSNPSGHFVAATEEEAA
jgi:hypothetical protein